MAWGIIELVAFPTESSEDGDVPKYQDYTELKIREQRNRKKQTAAFYAFCTIKKQIIL